MYRNIDGGGCRKVVWGDGGDGLVYGHYLKDGGRGEG